MTAPEVPNRARLLLELLELFASLAAERAQQLAAPPVRFDPEQAARLDRIERQLAELARRCRSGPSRPELVVLWALYRYRQRAGAWPSKAKLIAELGQADPQRPGKAPHGTLAALDRLRAASQLLRAVGSGSEATTELTAAGLELAEPAGELSFAELLEHWKSSPSLGKPPS